MYPVIIGATIPAIFDTVFCIPPMVPTKLESGAISPGIAHGMEMQTSHTLIQ